MSKITIYSHLFFSGKILHSKQAWFAIIWCAGSGWTMSYSGPILSSSPHQEFWIYEKILILNKLSICVAQRINEVTWNRKSNRSWKFLLSTLTKKHMYSEKKYELWHPQNRPGEFFSQPSNRWRNFWIKYFEANELTNWLQNCKHLYSRAPINCTKNTRQDIGIDQKCILTLKQSRRNWEAKGGLAVIESKPSPSKGLGLLL